MYVRTYRDITHLLTFRAVMDGSRFRVESDVHAFDQVLRELVVAVATGQVRAGELELVVLVPVLQRQLEERGSVGKLQVGKVPVQDLAVARREVDSSGERQRRGKMKREEGEK